MYLNFLSLHIAITILVSPHYSRVDQYIDYADELLKYFVKTFETIYGANLISYNVHNLLHLVNDVRRYGHLDRFSAFKFENTIFKMKNMIRKYEKPLQQIARRFAENQIAVFDRRLQKVKANLQIFDKQHRCGPVTNQNLNVQYKRLHYNNFLIDVDNYKNDSILIDDTFVKVYNFARHNDVTYVIGKQLMPVGEIYTKPCGSARLMSNIVKIDDKLRAWPCDKIKAKLCKLFFDNKTYVFPLSHTYVL